jgi:hypothetical protein
MKRVIKLTESDVREMIRKLTSEEVVLTPKMKISISKFLDKEFSNHEFHLGETNPNPYDDTTTIKLHNPEDNLTDVAVYYNGDIGIRSMFLDDIMDYFPFERKIIYDEVEEWARNIIEYRGESYKVSDAIKKRDN